jgi:hypothetical protein
MAGEEVAVQIADVEDVRQVLAACLTFFQAEDLKSAQLAFSAVRPSPLSLEVERLATRFRGYLGDYYLAQREAELEAEDAESDGQTTDGTDPEAFDEELSESPLGEFNPPKQEGRRLRVDELYEAAGGDLDEDEDENEEPTDGEFEYDESMGD